MNGIEEVTITTEDATKAARIWLRAFMRAANQIGDQRIVMKAQEAKIAEQAALLDQRQTLLDRHNAAAKAQAFQLGKQDRELVQLRSKVAELQAGDVGRLRQSVDFQAMEIQRLKAALAWKHAGEALAAAGNGMVAAVAKMGPALMCGTATAIVEEAEDATDDQWFIWEAERQTPEAKVAELETDLAAAKKWIVDLTAERDAAQTVITDLRDELTIKTHFAAGLLDSVKALQNDVERLKGIADHSNNLAQNRLEELARLRKELAVAREATANLEAKLTANSPAA